jgi:hypothetical protein
MLYINTYNTQTVETYSVQYNTPCAHTTCYTHNTHAHTHRNEKRDEGERERERGGGGKREEKKKRERGGRRTRERDLRGEGSEGRTGNIIQQPYSGQNFG